MEAPPEGIILRDTADELDLIREDFHTPLLNVKPLPSDTHIQSTKSLKLLIVGIVLFNMGIALIVGLLIAFSDDDFIEPDDPGIIVVEPTSTPPSCAGKLVGPEGGNLFIDNGAGVLIPRGAVHANTCFVFERLEIGTPTDKYRIQATQPKFDRPVTLVIPFTNEENLKMVITTDNGREILPHSIHYKTMTAWVQVAAL